MTTIVAAKPTVYIHANFKVVTLSKLFSTKIHFHSINFITLLVSLFPHFTKLSLLLKYNYHNLGNNH